MLKTLIPLLALTKLALAGCETHTFGSCEDGIVHWYDPNTGEICDPVDCGGGRAPPKTGPGCAGYTGTEVLTTSYLSCFTKSTSEALLASATNASSEPTTGADETTKATSKSTKHASATETKSAPSSTAASASDNAVTINTTPTASASTGTPAASSAAASSTEAPNVGSNLDSSFIAAVGAAIGAFALI